VKIPALLPNPTPSRRAATENSPQFQLRDLAAQYFQATEGRQTLGAKNSSVPAGLNTFLSMIPAAKAAGYFQPHLWC
jgi:hypothetical protein